MVTANELALRTQSWFTESSTIQPQPLMIRGLSLPCTATAPLLEPAVITFFSELTFLCDFTAQSGFLSLQMRHYHLVAVYFCERVV